MAQTCEEKLAEAKQALHDLNIGKSTVEVWDGDFRARYTSANIDRLQAYVNALDAQCGDSAASGCGCANTRRPLTFMLGC